MKLCVKIFFFLLLIGKLGLAQQAQHRKVFFRLGISPVLSFYNTNEYHTSSTNRSAAFQLSGLLEFKINKQLAFLTGLEYLAHGLSFNSYFFKPGMHPLYNENFDYNYRVFINEINLPVLFRLHPRSEGDNHFSPYFSLGYDFRYILFNHLNVKSTTDASNAFDDFTKITFEYPYLYPQGSSFLVFAFGGQKNFLTTHKAIFMEACYKYSLTRMFIDESFIPSSMFIRNHHLLITFGVKI